MSDGQSQRIQQIKTTLKAVWESYLEIIFVPAMFLAAFVAAALFMGLVFIPLWVGLYVEFGLYPWQIAQMETAPSAVVTAGQVVWLVVVVPAGLAVIDVLTGDYV